MTTPRDLTAVKALLAACVDSVGHCALCDVFTAHADGHADDCALPAAIDEIDELEREIKDAKGIRSAFVAGAMWWSIRTGESSLLSSELALRHQMNLAEQEAVRWFVAKGGGA